MDNFKLIFLVSVTLSVLAYTSGCSPEDVTQKEEGYKIGSKISVLAEFTSTDVKKRMLVTKYPKQYDYERIGDSKFWIVISNHAYIESRFKEAYKPLDPQILSKFHTPGLPPPVIPEYLPTKQKPHHYVFEIYIKEKSLAEFPEFDAYTVEIIDIRRVEGSEQYKYR